MAEQAGKYDPKAIEAKWQQVWEDTNAFAANDASSNPKLYLLDMFPYPSGEGLHVGHVEGYTATDIYSRYQRAKGYNVLHPMGWDAFGLPAENYAIKTGIHPKETTDKAINNFRRQIKRLGLSYDWSREFGTHTPEYYRWTQWLFTTFFNKGLVYKKKALVNWDPVDQTVLANEQVLPDGTAERSGAKVEKKELEQWFFKITDYADELIDSLDTIDWPESTKAAQRNWIGRSEGAEIDFKLVGAEGSLRVFTTRPDTLFGATYMVIAPEHPLAKASSDAEVKAYVAAALNKSDIDRSAEGREKTGVEIKGITAVNPANGEALPIYIADYVLGGYGTGAIMAVPAHDERDYEFAQKFNIPIKQVIEPVFEQETDPGRIVPGLPFEHRNAIIAIVKHWSEDKYLVLRWKKVAWLTFVTGGIEGDQTPEAAARREILEETGYTNLELVDDFGVIHGKFYHVPKQVNRHAHSRTLVFKLIDSAQEPVSAEEEGNHAIEWMTKAELAKELTPGSHLRALEMLNGNLFYGGAGILVNSGQFDGMDSEEAKKAITEHVGGRMVKTYRLRDWLISRQRYWGAPIPIVYDPSGAPHAIPPEHLPWLLPTDVEFKPTGTSPLGQSKELLERTERIFGKGWRPEADTMDTFACSSWYFFRFADPHNTQEFASKEALAKWLPVDLYVGGAEHTVLHLLYARFFTKALRDMGYVAFGEPFLKLRHQGIILAEDSRKMSKRFGNVINPDDMVEQFGADALRLYEMFMGPLETMKPWNTGNVAGVRRFLERVWRLSDKLIGEAPSAQLDALLNQTIKKIGEDIEALKFNTAISALMILLNKLEEEPSAAAYRTLVVLLAPFAPHIANELAERLQVALTEWPAYDASKLLAQTVRLGVQVNGKLRGTIEVSPTAPEDEAVSLAKAEPMVAKWLGEAFDEAQAKGEAQVVYKPGKILSFSVKS